MLTHNGDVKAQGRRMREKTEWKRTFHLKKVVFEVYVYEAVSISDYGIGSSSVRPQCPCLRRVT
jgi:hypothetical protein